MDKSSSGFRLAEVVSSDNKNKPFNSIGTDLGDARGCSLSPPVSADEIGAPNTGCSTGDGSVFTFNSVTDESSDEKKSDPSSPVIKYGVRQIFDSDDCKDVSRRDNLAGDGISYRDKQNFIKMTLHKEYIHVVRYDYQTLLRKIKEIKDFEEAENSNQAAQSLGKENDASKIRKQLDSTSTSEGISTGGSSSPCPHEPTVKEKFSSRVFKNLFSIVTSPMSERRTDKGGATTQQCKKSKSSSSPSLARQDGTGVKGGSKSSTGEARHEKKRAKQAASEIKQDGSTV